MNKKISRLLSIALVLMLCMVFAVPAMANTGASSTNDPNGTNNAGKYFGTSVTFDKNLIMDENAIVPAKSFTFKLEANPAWADSGIADITAFAGILDGVNANGTTLSSTGENVGEFSVSITANQDVTVGATGDKVTENDKEKYATTSFNIDFSGVTFPGPGVYRYKLTELAPTATDGITYDAGNNGTVYYIDVYVEYEKTTVSDGNATWANDLSIANIVVTKNTANQIVDDQTSVTGKVNASGTGGTSEGDFNNKLNTYDLEVQKVVTGNQGERDKYFKFTVSISNALAGTYDIVYEKGNTYSSDGSGNPTTITIADGQTSVSNIEIWLKTGESFKITNLPYGASYTIAEPGTAGYTTTIGVAGDTDASKTEANTAGERSSVSDTSMTDDTTVTFTNDRTGTIPTGILMTIAPFAALMLIGFVGIIFVMLKKKSATNK